MLKVDTLTSIYNAAISPVGWNEAIDRCAFEAQACSGAFVTYNAIDPASYSLSALGKSIRDRAQQEPALLAEFMQTIAPLEMVAHEHMRQFPSRRIWKDSEQWADPAGAEARTHYDWMKNKLGIGPKLAARLNDNPQIHDTFVLHFSDGKIVPDTSLTAFSQMLPHLAKSAEMSIVYNTLQQLYAAALTMLDKVGIGLCILDNSGSVVISNTEAQRILDSGHGLNVSTNGKLKCANSDEHTKLTNAINSSQLHSQVIRAESILSIRRNPTENPLVIEVSPLRDSLDELNYGLNGVLVQLIDIGSRAHCSLDAFVIAYKLTPAERLVTKYVLDGLSNREIAEERGTSTETVKSQLKSIMNRTEAHSRVELVRRILKTEVPIVN